MKLSQLMLTVMLMSSATLAFTASADGSGEGMRGHASEKAHARRGAMQHLLAGVELTDEQKQKIKQLTAQHRAEAKAAGNDSRTQMRQLMAADNFDEIVAKQLILQRQEQKLQRQLQRLQLQHQILQLLSPEQREQVEANMAKPPKDRFARKQS